MSAAHRSHRDLDTIATSNPARRDMPQPTMPSIANMKAHLRTMLALAVFAAMLSAQSNDYTAALQRAKLIEQQEGNLDAALEAYTALLDDSKAPQSVHDAACFGLGAMYWRLGKRDDARTMLGRLAGGAGEYADRAKQLLQSDSVQAQGEKERIARARAIIKRYAELVAQRPKANASTSELERELRQLGKAAAVAIAEQLNVGPALRNNGKVLNYAEQPVLSFLVQQLWMIGTEPAQQFFLDAAANAPLPWQRFLTAYNTGAAKDLVPALLQFTQTNDPTREVWRQATSLIGMQSDEAVAAALANNHVATREAGLVALASRWNNMPKKHREQFLSAHGSTVTQAFDHSKEPLRNAMWGLMEQFFRHGPREAQSLFLEQVRKHPDEVQYSDRSRSVNGFDGDDAWMQQLANTAKVLGPIPSPGASPAHQSVSDLLWKHKPVWTAAAVADVATLIDLGYTDHYSPGEWLNQYANHASTAQRAKLILKFPRMGQVSELAYHLAKRNPKPGLLPAIAQVLAQCTEDAKIPWYDHHEDSQDIQYLLILAATCDPENAGAVIGDFATSHLRQLPRTVGILGSLSMGRDDLAARTALRQLLVMDGVGTDKQGKETRSFIFSELVRAGDVQAIPLFPKAYELGLGQVQSQYANLDMNNQSYASPQRHGGTGLALLAANNSSLRRFWHGYDGKDLASAWQILLSRASADAAWNDLLATGYQPPTEGLTAFAQQLHSRWKTTRQDMRSRLRSVIWGLQNLPAEATRSNPALRATLEALVADEDDSLAVMVFEALPHDIAKEYSEQALQGLRRGKNPQWLHLMSHHNIPMSKEDWTAVLTGDSDTRITALNSINKDADRSLRATVDAQLTNPSASVRLAACSAMARMFGEDAVGALLPMLQDKDDRVIKQARGHLNQMREIQEQRNFWGNKGGQNITAANSAAKLIAQAMPTEDREQRVLAIRSLALLNAPEALPYLIDWTKDKDADVQAEARKAITAMHQSGGTQKSSPKK